MQDFSLSLVRLLLAVDPFEHRTRLSVAIMALLPAIVGLAGLYSIDLKEISLSVLSVIFGGSWVLGQFVQSLGQRKQQLLRDQWDGRPATLLLRHRNPTVAASLKEVWHERYAARLNVRFPTAAEEWRHPKGADAIYAQAASWSERYTERRTKFPILWQCRTQYEFFLNGFALRGIGLTIDVFCGAWTCLKSGGVSFGSHPEWELSAFISLRPGSAAVVAVSALMASVWIFWFTENRVRANAESYDRQLLEIGGEPFRTGNADALAQT